MTWIIAVAAGVPIGLVLIVLVVVFARRRCRVPVQPKIHKIAYVEAPAPLPRPSHTLPTTPVIIVEGFPGSEIPPSSETTEDSKLGKRATRRLHPDEEGGNYLDMGLGSMPVEAPPPVWSGTLAQLGPPRRESSSSGGPSPPRREIKWGSSRSMASSMTSLPQARETSDTPDISDALPDSDSVHDADDVDKDELSMEPDFVYPRNLHTVDMSRSEADRILREFGLVEGSYLFRTSRSTTVLSLVHDRKVGHFNVLSGGGVGLKELQRFVKHYSMQTDGFLPCLLGVFVSRELMKVRPSSNYVLPNTVSEEPAALSS